MRKLNAEAFLKRFDAMDAQLVAKGFHKTSIWWRREFERFLRSGRRRWVIRAGRRAGKSSFLCRLAVAWALWGPWSVPAGDVAVIPFVSVDRDEAGARIRTVRDILKALDIAADVRAEEIELIERVCIFRVETCSIRSVGFTAVMLVGDEMARWESRDTAANPAKEVMGSIRPTMATQDLAFEVCSSSPWGEDDYHCELFCLGQTEHQCVSFAATWTANPTISEERTHELEPDEKVWSREYAAIPGGVVSAALERDDVLAAIRGVSLGRKYELPPETPMDFAKRQAGQYRVSNLGNVISGGKFLGPGTILDLSEEEARSLGEAIEDVRSPPKHLHKWPLITVDLVSDFTVAEVKTMVRDDPSRASLDHVVDSIAARCKAGNIRLIFGDQRDVPGLVSGFARHGMAFKEYTWSDTSKDAAFLLLRRWLHDGDLSLPNHEKLRKQMISCKAKLLPSGRIKYETGGLDALSCLVTLAHAYLDDALPNDCGFCATDASSFRGDDFAYIIGHVGKGKGGSALAADLALSMSVLPTNIFAGWPHRGLG